MDHKFEPSCHREIIDAVWSGDVAAYAADMGITKLTARTHRYRNSIPSDYWDVIYREAKKRGFELTEGVMTRTKRPRGKTMHCGAHEAKVSN